MKLTRMILGPALALLIALLIALPITGCDTKGSAGEGADVTATVEVKVVGWNGWDHNDKPAPSTTTVELSRGAAFEVDVLTGPVTFEVSAIDVDSMELETSEPFALMNVGGVIDLNDPTDEFTLPMDGSLKVATPTMDAGTNVTLTLV